MSPRQSSQHAPPVPSVPRVDMTALGARLIRLRYQRGWSQATLAQRAGVDAMVISRLEQGRKPRLEVESAARLAQACGWTLDQLCGLAAIPDLRDAPWEPWYSPLSEEQPAWLQAGLSTTTHERRLAALILSWQARGARMPHIAETLHAWGLRPMGLGVWTAATITETVTRWTYGTKKGRKALLTEYQRDHETWC